MSKRPEPHTQRDLIKPLEGFSQEAEKKIKDFGDYIRGMSPVDGVRCLGFLRKASRDMRDAANSLVATVDAHAQRVRWMKEANRKRRDLKRKRSCSLPFQNSGVECHDECQQRRD